MRLTFIIDSLRSGGKEKQLILLVEELSKNNDVQLIVFNDNIFLEKIFELDIELVIFEKLKITKPSKIFRTQKIIRKFSPSIIHSWDNYSSFVLLPFILLSHNIKLISSIRYAGKIVAPFYKNILKNIVFNMSGSIISNSWQGLIVEKLEKNLKGKVVSNGLNLQDFNAHKSALVYEQVKISEHKTNIIMVANFTKAKDYKTYIKAARKILALKKDCDFYCVGSGESEYEFQKYASNDLNNGIFFLGKVKEIPSLLSKMQIGVLLNNTNGHAEGMSNSIMEYMASGLPIIATDAGGTPELIRDRENGFLVPAFNVTEVIKKITFLSGDKKKAKEMGNLGRKIIRDEFNITSMTKSYLKIYRELSNG